MIPSTLVYSLKVILVVYLVILHLAMLHKKLVSRFVAKEIVRPGKDLLKDPEVRNRALGIIDATKYLNEPIHQLQDRAADELLFQVIEIYDAGFLEDMDDRRELHHRCFMAIRLLWDARPSYIGVAREWFSDWMCLGLFNAKRGLYSAIGKEFIY